MSAAPLARAGARPDDAALVARVAAQDLEALGLLFDRFEADVRRFVGRLGVARDERDDVVQATFVELVRAAASYDGESPVRPWVLGVAAMMVRRHRRSIARIARRVAALGAEPAPEPLAGPAETLERREQQRRLRRALDKLSTKKREVIVMMVVEGATGEETAAALGIPINTVWTRLHHARRDLREILRKEGGS